MFLKSQSSLIDGFQIFVHSSSLGGGKIIIDANATVLVSNDVNLVFSVQEGDNLLTIFPDNSLDLSPKKLTQIIQSNTSIRQDIMVPDNGVDYWYQLLTSPISQEENGLFLVEFKDITHYKAMEASAKKQRSAIENEILLRIKEVVQTDLFTRDNGGFIPNFMRGLRHDLLSPITQLKDIIDFYKKTKDPKKKEQSARFMDECLQKLSNTTRGFSEFVDLHILPQNNDETINLTKVLEDVKDLLEEEISQTKAEIIEDFKKASTITFNKKIIASILYNLLSNALKFRQAAVLPIIEIKTFWEDAHFVLTVKDNGIGIDLAQYGHKLFTPFLRLNTDRPGNGVGLSMIKNTLLKYQGDIQIESVLGKGTTVRVLIPKQ